MVVRGEGKAARRERVRARDGFCVRVGWLSVGDEDDEDGDDNGNGNGNGDDDDDGVWRSRGGLLAAGVGRSCGRQPRKPGRMVWGAGAVDRRAAVAGAVAIAGAAACGPRRGCGRSAARRVRMKELLDVRRRLKGLEEMACAGAGRGLSGCLRGVGAVEGG